MATTDSALESAASSLDAGTTAAEDTSTAGVESTETPVGGEGATETAETGAEAGKPEAGAEGTEEVSPDGKVIPTKYREMFKKDPQLKALFFSERAYRNSFKSPSEAQAARELLERVGGEDGWMQVEDERAEHTRLNQQYTSPSVEHKREFVQGLLTDNSTAFKSMVPVALDVYAKADPSGYSRTLARVMVNTFSRAFNGLGVKGAFGVLQRNIEGNPKQALADLQAIIAEFDSYDQLATSNSGLDAEREEFERSKNEWESNRIRQEKTAEFNSYSEEVLAQGTASIRSHVQKLLANEKKPPLSREDLQETVDAIGNRINRLSNADRDWTVKRNAVIKSGDFHRLHRFVLAKLNQLLPEAAKQEMRRLNAFAAKPPARFAPANRVQPDANGQGQRTAGSIVHLSKAPAPSEINYARSEGMIMRGEAILKTGQHAKWD